MKRALLVLVCSQFVWAAERVEFSLGPLASPLLVRALAESRRPIRDVSAPHYEKESPLDSADCVASVLRPDRDDGELFSFGNKVLCRYHQTGSSKELTLDLSDVSIGRWGSVDRKPFIIGGAIANAIHEALRQAHQRDATNPLWAVMDSSFTTGDQIISHGIKRGMDTVDEEGREVLSTLALDCHYWIRHGRIDYSFCNFLIFELPNPVSGV